MNTLNIEISVKFLLADGSSEEIKAESKSFESAEEELGKLGRTYEKMLGEAEIGLI